MGVLYAGLDVGSTTCHQVVEDSPGTVEKDVRMSTSEANLIEAFRTLKGEVHVHLEACELAGWVRRVIKPFVKRVVVSHPKTNAWIAKDPRKNDRLDAKKLADLLRMSEVTPLHEVYYPDDDDRLEFKQVVQQHGHLGQEVVVLKQKIKSRLRQQGAVARGSSVYGEKGREKWLDQVTSPAVREAIRLEYALLDKAEECEGKVEKLMEKMGSRYPEVERLDTVPGVGPVLACRFVAYIQDPHRFSSRQDLWRYCGLAVAHPMSDGKPLAYECLDRWSGNPKLKDVSRKAFLGAMRSRQENAFQRAYAASLKRTHDKTHARLNVQRKIVAVMRAVWKGGVNYQDDMGKGR